MVKGLTEKQEKIVKDILKEFRGYQFFAYGSRVKGNFVKSSDFDILIKGESSASLELIDEIKTKFYESLLPFVVNVVDFYNIDDKFYDQIKQDLILL